MSKSNDQDRVCRLSHFEEIHLRNKISLTGFKFQLSSINEICFIEYKYMDILDCCFYNYLIFFKCCAFYAMQMTANARSFTALKNALCFSPTLFLVTKNIAEHWK